MFRAVLPYYLFGLTPMEPTAGQPHRGSCLQSLLRVGNSRLKRSDSGQVRSQADKADSQVIANLRRGRAWRPMATAGS